MAHVCWPKCLVYERICLAIKLSFYLRQSSKSPKVGTAQNVIIRKSSSKSALHHRKRPLLRDLPPLLLAAQQKMLFLLWKQVNLWKQSNEHCCFHFYVPFLKFHFSLFILFRQKKKMFTHTHTHKHTIKHTHTHTHTHTPHCSHVT